MRKKKTKKKFEIQSALNNLLDLLRIEDKSDEQTQHTVFLIEEISRRGHEDRFKEFKYLDQELIYTFQLFLKHIYTLFDMECNSLFMNSRPFAIMLEIDDDSNPLELSNKALDEITKKQLIRAGVQLPVDTNIMLLPQLFRIDLDWGFMCGPIKDLIKYCNRAFTGDPINFPSSLNRLHQQTRDQAPYTKLRCLLGVTNSVVNADDEFFEMREDKAKQIAKIIKKNLKLDDCRVKPFFLEDLANMDSFSTKENLEIFNVYSEGQSWKNDNFINVLKEFKPSIVTVTGDGLFQPMRFDVSKEGFFGDTPSDHVVIGLMIYRALQKQPLSVIVRSFTSETVCIRGKEKDKLLRVPIKELRGYYLPQQDYNSQFSFDKIDPEKLKYSYSTDATTGKPITPPDTRDHRFC